MWRKETKELEVWEKEVKDAKNEGIWKGRVWKVINRERKRRKSIKEGIEMREWEEYFRGLLRAVEWRMMKEDGRKEEEERENELEREEVERVLRLLKDGKAAGGDGIPNEVWNKIRRGGSVK